MVFVVTMWKRCNVVILTQELFNEILKRIEKGSTVSSICNDLCITRKRLLAFVNLTEENKKGFEEAQKYFLETKADEVFDLIDQEPERNGVTGCFDSASVTWQKNKAEIRIKMLERLSPKFAVKSESKLLGESDKPITVITRRIISGSKEDD